MKQSKNLSLGIFLVRNLLLYFLFFHAYLYFRADLDPVFLSVGFVLAVLLALLMDRLRLRFWAAFLLFVTTVFCLRLLFFLVFRLQAALSPGPHTDFLFFYFDKDFFPGLVPWMLVWLFNLLAFRYPRFVRLEAGFDALLLLVVFWSQGSYQISLYPHPTLLSYVIFLFLLLTIVLMVLVRVQEQAERWQTTVRSVASFLWVLVPLLLVVLLFVLGRYNQGAVRLGSGLMKPTLFRFDFSQYIKLESEIEMSDDLVLLFRKQGPAERILLRRYILSGYDRKRGFYHIPPGSRTSGSRTSGQKGWQGLPVTVPDSPEEFSDPGYIARHEVNQEYFFVNFDPTSLIGMNYPVRVAPLTNWDASSFLRIYRVVSRVSNAGLEDLASADLLTGTAADRDPRQPDSGSRPAAPMSAQELEVYTNYGDNERIRELAEQIVPPSLQLDRLNQALRIHDYLKDNYYYSLMPGLAADGDQLSHFLYSSKKGYCSYFAFSMTLLCRSLGIPARVVVGFYVNPNTEVLNFYEVRAYQAHAWVEVYFGEYGWIEFDPSSEVIAPGEEDTIQFGFDFETFARLLEEILKNQHSLEEQRPESIEVEDRVRLLGGELIRGLMIVARLWYFTLPVLYLLVITLMKTLPLLRVRFSGDQRAKIKHLFAAARITLESLGLKKSGEESLLEYALRIEDCYPLRLSGWVQGYLQAVFDEVFEDSDFEQALEKRREFLTSLRRCFSPLRRALAFLNPLPPLGRVY
ncbi:MAG: transglutaminase domain-containing protein [Spirochaetaceae bacterium]|nr:MAG: transglutaminase domain-containing protein [Spirochaetaceae bacterium]